MKEFWLNTKTNAKRLINHMGINSKSLYNLFSAIVEALITLAITQIPFWLVMALHALGDKNASFTSSLSAVISKLSHGDALTLSAGILASSTAYAIMKITDFNRRPSLMLHLILFPIVVIMIAMPLYIQDLNDAIENASFANGYLLIVLLLSTSLWLYALYQARAFFDVSVSGAAGADRIIEELER